MRFLVLSSSRGTTFQSILDRIADGSLTAPCLGLVADRPERGCVEKAKKAGLPVAVVERKDGESREDYDKRLHEAILRLAQLNKTEKLKTKNFLIAAIGWMFVLSPWFIGKWRGKIINVHPALLPRHGGTGMYGIKVHEAVLRAGEKESGMTIHLMDEGVDTGRILLQKTCPVLPGDMAETLRERVQGLEREWYPKVLEMIAKGELRLE